MFTISHIDHLVLTVKHIPTTLEFYARVLGMYAIQFEGNDNAPRIALTFADQKINLHEVEGEFEPRAHTPTPGSADLCLITETNLEHAIAYANINPITNEIASTLAMTRYSYHGSSLSAIIRY